MDTINNPFLYVNFSKNDYIVIVIGGKNTKGYVVTRVRNCDSLKTKTTQSILLDPESAKQHIRRGKLQCYQYKHYTDSSAGLGKLIFVLLLLLGRTRNTDRHHNRGLFKHQLTSVYWRSKLNFKMSFEIQSFKLKNKEVITTA